jgi:hypothetical protein
LFAGGDADLYGYLENNPINFIDPSGLWWEYSQSTGKLRSHTAPLEVTDIGTGYSGSGSGLNNQAMQNKPFVGPIPQGYYDIGPQYNSPNTGPSVMDLTPWGSTNTFGRNNFQIHGDNACGCNSASQGCIVVGPQIRNKIANSGDTLLRVIK